MIVEELPVHGRPSLHLSNIHGFRSSVFLTKTELFRKFSALSWVEIHLSNWRERLFTSLQQSDDQQTTGTGE